MSAKCQKRSPRDSAGPLYQCAFGRGPPMYGNRPKTTTNEYPRYPCRSSSVKDKSLFTQSWDADGSAQDLWDEDYAVINFRGEEVFPHSQPHRSRTLDPS